METTNEKEKAKTYILLGPPGSGKSTQAEYLNMRFGAVHLDMGGALRRAAAEPTAIGKKLYENINGEHALGPDGVMRAVLEEELGKVPEDVLSEADSIERISNRFACTACGAKLILGKDFAVGGACPSCGGAVTQRADDTREGVSTRWRIFHEDTVPVLDFFATHGKLIRVSGTEPAESISAKIDAAL